MIELRRSQPVLRRRRFFSGQTIYGSGRKDIGWFLPSGSEVTDAEWFDTARRSLGMILNGDEIPDRDARGERIGGDTLMVLLHAGPAGIKWRIPASWGEVWKVLVDTAAPAEEPETRSYQAGQSIDVLGRSLLVLKREPSPPPA
jgi:glycogen operon protein